MTQKAADHPTTRPPRADSASSASTLGTLGLDFLDTTWRIAVPVLLFAIIGIFADKKLETAPWLTLLGVVIGFVGAGLLVKKQLSAALAAEDKKEAKS